MLRTQSLSFAYPPSRSFEFPNITLHAGEQQLLLGPSGSGKTTLLHLLAGLLRPTQGEIWLNGTPLHELPAQRLDRFRGQNVGIVFQRSHLIAALNVEQNLALAMSVAGNKTNNKRITDLLERLGIASRRRAHAHQLSQGEAQRANIARALVNHPRIVLADEPTSSLDDANTETAYQLLHEQTKALGAALLIVTHDARLKPYVAQHTYLTENNSTR